MNCRKPYQPYGLLQLHKPYSTNKQVYQAHLTHTCTMDWGLACKVQGLHNATLILPRFHFIHYTRRYAHAGDEIFKKGVVVDRDLTRGGNATGRHFLWKKGIANRLSRMNLMSDLGFTCWLRLVLPRLAGTVLV